MKRFLMSRKNVYTLMAVLFLFSALMSKVLILQVKAEPDEITVPDNYSTIQEAINAANPGDTIYIRSGAYYEHLSVNKPLTLVGENKENTIIDGSGKNQTIITVTANNVFISGFTVRNCSRKAGTSYAGIKVSGHACNVTGNFVTKTKMGIFVTSQESRIAKNVAKNNGHGIALHSSSEITVEANNVSANTVGISLALSFNNKIVRNRAVNSSFGGHGIIMSSQSFNNTVCANELMNNYHGMWLSDSSDNLIFNNTIAYNELLGIELASSSNNIFYHNNIIDNPTPVRVDTGVSTESICTWDDSYPSGGNYWHHYTDFDEKSGPNQDQIGNDGIWDHPYKIDVNNQDNYPSVEPYSEVFGVIVDEMKPIADAGSPQTVNVGVPVTFNGSRSTDNVGIIGYFWDFGDGANGTGMITTHTYNSRGVYTVTLTVKDATDKVDTDTITVAVILDGTLPIWVIMIPVIVGGTIAAVLFWKNRVRNKRKKMLRKTRSRRHH